MPSVCSRTFREATVCRQSVLGRSEKQMYAVSLFSGVPRSKCMPSVCSRTFREATVCRQSVLGRSEKPLYAVSRFSGVPRSRCSPTPGCRTPRSRLDEGSGSMSSSEGLNTLLGAVSRLRRVRSKAPALQRSGFCKAAVETGHAPSLLLRRRLEPSPSRTEYNS
jgi:hypothetical protein